ncbi:MAG: glycosyltransferase family 1 protein [Ectothiorhodospiraceae bacterium]|nr:glycosyltransferase family 1 protein [Ectothiorhodospiraceae bacterium]
MDEEVVLHTTTDLDSNLEKGIISCSESKSDSTADSPENFLQGNLSLLEKNYPKVYSCLTQDSLSCKIERSTLDNNSLNITTNQKSINISSQRRDEALSSVSKPSIVQPTYLLIGLGVGDELFKLFEFTTPPFSELPNFKLPIYVVEPDPLMLIAAMWLHDFTEIILSSRVLFFIGEKSSTELLKFFKTHRTAIYPTHTINYWYSTDDPIVQENIKNIGEIRNTTSVVTYKLRIKTRKYYDNISQKEWHELFKNKNRPLRIMGWTSRFTTFLQYCTRDLLAGFTELGHDVKFYCEDTDISRINQYDILTTIDEFKPDLIIVIDHFRDEFPYLPINIPYVNWIQDMLENITNPKFKITNPLDFTYVFASKWLEDLKIIPAYSEHIVDVLNLGINKNTYYPIKPDKKTFDVLYVSHLLDISLTLRPFITRSLPFHKNLEEINILKNKFISEDELILMYKNIAEEFDSLVIDDLWKYKSDPTTLEYFIVNTLKKNHISDNEIVRQHFMQSPRVSYDIYFAIKTRPLISMIKQGVDIRIYGKNWNKVQELSPYSRGPIKNGKDLNSAMNQAKICLNNSPGTSLHMRALEILGSGSFMLSRDINPDDSDIKHFFKKNEEIYFFSNEDDITSIVNYWLENETERNIKSLSAHKKSLEIFEYKIIAEKIINAIPERF